MHIQLGAISHNVYGNIGVGRDDHALNFFGNRSEVRITRDTLDLGCVGVQCDDFATRLAQSTVDRVGWLLGVARYAGDRYAVELKEVGDGARDVGHRVLVRRGWIGRKRFTAVGGDLDKSLRCR